MGSYSLALPRPQCRMSSPAARRRSASSRQSPLSHAVAAAAASNQDVQGAMLDAPSPANKNYVRLAAVAGER